MRMEQVESALERIVKNGLVVLPDAVRRLDIGIRGGRIAVLADRIEAGEQAEVWDAEGCYVLPGMIDAHVHLNEPAMGHWEGFATGSSALAAGGCTTYIDMPLNGIPPTVTANALRLKLERAEGSSFVDYALWGGLMPGKLEHLGELAEAGVAGFKAFMSEPGGEGDDIFTRSDDVTLLEGMKLIAALGGVLALHAESETLTAGLTEMLRRSGRTGPRDYAASRPPLAELEAVRRALLFAEKTGCALHFVHLSTAAAVEAVRDAKQAGLDVTAETCPHYLLLTDEAMETHGARAKCAPPLRPSDERERLWALLAAGDIDIVASDHSPCPPELKEKDDFFTAWGGIAGAQSSLEAVIGEGFVRRGIPIERLSRILSLAPARRFGLHPRKGEIAVYADADLAIVDMRAPYTLRREQLLDRHRTSPYAGMTMAAKVTATFVRGMPVYTADQGMLGEPQGVWLQRGWRGG